MITILKRPFKPGDLVVLLPGQYSSVNGMRRDEIGLVLEEEMPGTKNSELLCGDKIVCVPTVYLTWYINLE